MRTPPIAVFLVVIAAGLSSSCPRGGDGGGPAPGLVCSDQAVGTLKGAGTPTPDFSNRSSVAFFKIAEIPSSATVLTIGLTSTGGDADLHLAGPGVPRGSVNAGDYVFASQEAAPVTQDWVRVSLLGLENPSTFLSTVTLKDYRDAGGFIACAVWGVEPNTSFELEILCDNSLTLPCDLAVEASLDGSGRALPDFASGEDIHFFEVQGLPVAPGAVVIRATTTSGDVNLFLGRPGLGGPSGDPTDFAFSSVAPSTSSAIDRILIDDTGLHDVFGSTNPLVTLQDYLLAGANLWFAVAGVADTSDYRVRVSCSAVDALGCGKSLVDAVNGSGQSPPDLTDPLETRYYQIDCVPPTASSLTIMLDSLGGDADLFIGAPGIPPGSTDITDYIFSSTERAPSLVDEITVDAAGLRDGTGGTSTAATLSDYLQSGGPVVFAVTGFDVLSTYDVSIGCVAPPQVIPIACDSPVNGSVAGSGQIPPDLTDLVENLWFELPSVPPAASSVRITLESGSGNADLYLASPGVPPGSQDPLDYVVTSISIADVDELTLCNSGVLSTTGGAQASPTLVDYSVSGQNLSFVVAGVDPRTLYTLTVECSLDPPQQLFLPISCGGVAAGSVSGMLRSPPDFGNVLEVDFFEISPIPPGSVPVNIRLIISTGDANLWLAAPGSVPGSTCSVDYVASSESPSDDFLTISGCGISGANGDLGAYTLADYQAAGAMAVAVAGYAAQTDYSLEVDCSLANACRPTDCGGTVTDTVAGSLVGNPLPDPSLAHIYEIPLSSVQGSTFIIIEINVGTDDAEIYLAAPGIAPGSVCLGDYPFRATSTLNPEWIRVDAFGLRTADGWSASSPTIADYQAVAENLSFAIVGYSPSTTYSLTITCN